jgi:hypothetical protein
VPGRDECRAVDATNRDCGSTFSIVARRGTWLLLLLVAFAAQLGISRPAAGSPRSDVAASTVEVRSGTPAPQARRDPGTASRSAAKELDRPDALFGASRWSLPSAELVDVVEPDRLVGTSTRRRRGCACPRGPPSFEH